MALGNKSFTTASIVFTFLATNIDGGSIFGASKAIYSSGIISTISTFGIVLHYLFLAYILPSKIIKFKKAITLGDVVKKII